MVIFTPRCSQCKSLISPPLLACLSLPKYGSKKIRAHFPSGNKTYTIRKRTTYMRIAVNTTPRKPKHYKHPRTKTKTTQQYKSLLYTYLNKNLILPPPLTKHHPNLSSIPSPRFRDHARASHNPHSHRRCPHYRQRSNSWRRQLLRHRLRAPSVLCATEHYAVWVLQLHHLGVV